MIVSNYMVPISENNNCTRICTQQFRHMYIFFVMHKVATHGNGYSSFWNRGLLIMVAHISKDVKLISKQLLHVFCHSQCKETVPTIEHNIRILLLKHSFSYVCKRICIHIMKTHLCLKKKSSLFYLKKSFTL